MFYWCVFRYHIGQLILLAFKPMLVFLFVLLLSFLFLIASLPFLFFCNTNSTIPIFIRIGWYLNSNADPNKKLAFSSEFHIQILLIRTSDTRHRIHHIQSLVYRHQHDHMPGISTLGCRRSPVI